MTGFHVFISSPIGGLQATRIELKRWIEETYGFRVTLSEHGNVLYVPGQSIEQSCYEAVRECDFLILLVGDRYGSAAKSAPAWLPAQIPDGSGVPMSVTRWEFRVARHDRIPVFAFVDQAVIDRHKDRESTVAAAWTADARGVDHFFHELQEDFTERLPMLGTNIQVENIKSALRTQWSLYFSRFARFHRETALRDSVATQIAILERVTGQLVALIGKQGLGLPNAAEELSLLGRKQRFVASTVAGKLAAATERSPEDLFDLLRLQYDPGSAVEVFCFRKLPNGDWQARNGKLVSTRDLWEAIAICKGEENLPTDLRNKY